MVLHIHYYMLLQLLLLGLLHLRWLLLLPCSEHNLLMFLCHLHLQMFDLLSILDFHYIHTYELDNIHYFRLLTQLRMYNILFLNLHLSLISLRYFLLLSSDLLLLYLLIHLLLSLLLLLLYTLIQNLLLAYSKLI